MNRPPETTPPADRVVLLGLLVLLLFASPLVLWWTDPASPWYLPYLLWLLAIVPAAWLFGRRHRDEP